MFLIMENYVLEWSRVWLHHKIDKKKKDWNSWLKFSHVVGKSIYQPIIIMWLGVITKEKQEVTVHSHLTLSQC
jgi:hypothetical protein